ncbi:hypothetical protein DXI23_20270 [Marinobacter flavimaris]|uniref:Uncharacterized protein n=1 Tax=Marinobacter flavimaris TaxID=262076 RepID=A0A3D8GX87_9GAMM|nr:hypothetical protein [Marinobacter flavimaris]PPI78446.1 hypothetical protein MDHKLMBL_20065 [Marinobacter flavimaris]RDU39065.1 hypothetical protein DXI23_20270 [Marinobacter flavimaris]
MITKLERARDAAMASGKREPVVMLRMNIQEIQRLDELIYDSGWTGDISTFVRDRVLSKRRKKPKSGATDQRLAIQLDETISALTVVIHRTMEKADTEDLQPLKECRLILSRLAKALYSGH